MLKAFIKSIVNELIIIVITLLLFGLIFFLFDLPFGAFLLGAAIIVFVMVIYWLVKLSGF